MPERCVSCTKTSPSAHPVGRRSFIEGSHGENVRRNWLILAAAAATLPHDLSPWGMFMAADIVVKGVMLGLAFASLVFERRDFR